MPEREHAEQHCSDGQAHDLEHIPLDVVDTEDLSEQYCDTSFSKYSSYLGASFGSET
jgi:hypothetical protein